MAVYRCPLCGKDCSLMVDIKAHLKREHKKKKGDQVKVDTYIYL